MKKKQRYVFPTTDVVELKISNAILEGSPYTTEGNRDGYNPTTGQYWGSGQ